MKRLIAALAVLVGVASAAPAQNNHYAWTPAVARGQDPRVEVYDDFLDSTVANYWNTALFNFDGSDAQAAVTVSAEAYGVLKVTSGNVSSGAAADISGIGLDDEYFTPGDQTDNNAAGQIMMEARVTQSVASESIMFIGFTDTVADEYPFTVSGTTITSNATNAVGFVYDYAATEAGWLGIGVNDDTDSSLKDLDTALDVDATGESWHTYRVTIDNWGTAILFYDGVRVASIGDAVATDSLLVPAVLTGTNDTTSTVIGVDYFYAGAQRD